MHLPATPARVTATIGIFGRSDLLQYLGMPSVSWVYQVQGWSAGFGSELHRAPSWLSSAAAPVPWRLGPPDWSWEPCSRAVVRAGRDPSLHKSTGTFSLRVAACQSKRSLCRTGLCAHCELVVCTSLLAVTQARSGDAILGNISSDHFHCTVELIKQEAALPITQSQFAWFFICVCMQLCHRQAMCGAVLPIRALAWRLGPQAVTCA